MFDPLSSLAEARRVLEIFASDHTAAAITEIVRACATRMDRGGKIIACGNGGSLADAMHFCEELTGRFRHDRPAYPAIALSDATHLTCVANDYGYERVFSRGVEALGGPNDVLFALSTSGNSPNVLRAAEAARARGLVVVALTGDAPCALAPLADIHLAAPGTTSDRIQELHMLALHIIVEGIETEMAALRAYDLGSPG